MTQVTPIQECQLDEIGAFLHERLARRISPQAWVESLMHDWARERPNFGMQLRDGDRLVGVICAVYSDQWIAGKLERFCNPHSWCVLDEYRNASIKLVLELLKQRDYHFTMFTPNPKVAQVFVGLRFRLLDPRMLYIANLPSPWPVGAFRFLESDKSRIGQRLEGAALREFEAHRNIPWLEFVAFGSPGDACLVIYKRERWKKMACAWMMHVSNPESMQRHGRLLRHHLLMRLGIPVSRVETRFLSVPPALAYRTRRSQPKLVASRTLSDSQVRDVYSELVALDL